MEEGCLVAEGVALFLEVGVVGAVGIAPCAYFAGAGVHHAHGSAGGMGWVVHRAILNAPVYVGLVLLQPLLSGCAGEAVFDDAAQIAAGAVDIVVVLALAVDEAAEVACCGSAAAVDRLGPVVGCFAEHVELAGAFGGFDKACAPVEDLVAVGQGDDWHGGVDVFAGFHRLDGLGGVEPVLGEERDGVDVAGADVVERGVGVAGVELALPVLKVGEAGDAVRLAVAEGDAIDEGMAHEEVGEGAAEGSQADDSEADAHFGSFFSGRCVGAAAGTRVPEENKCLVAEG